MSHLAFTVYPGPFHIKQKSVEERLEGERAKDVGIQDNILCSSVFSF